MFTMYGQLSRKRQRTILNMALGCPRAAAVVSHSPALARSIVAISRTPVPVSVRFGRNSRPGGLFRLFCLHVVFGSISCMANVRNSWFRSGYAALKLLVVAYVVAAAALVGERRRWGGGVCRGGWARARRSFSTGIGRRARLGAVPSVALREMYAHLVYCRFSCAVGLV